MPVKIPKIYFSSQLVWEKLHGLSSTKVQKWSSVKIGITAFIKAAFYSLFLKAFFKMTSSGRVQNDNVLTSTVLQMSLVNWLSRVYDARCYSGSLSGMAA